MPHEEVLKTFYAKLKGVGNEGLIRVIDLAKECQMSYRQLSGLLRSSGLEPVWIGGKAFVYKDEANRAIVCAS
ncbi:MAG: hypothetical protein WCC10_08820 [Tumebacillaceae bacterium]